MGGPCPRSRHNPQFNRDALPISWEAVQIAYIHFPGLGGLRHARTDSPNSGWHNLSFRGYADYMQSVEFCENGRGTGEQGALCLDVCRSSSLALLPVDDRGCTSCPGVRVEDIIGPKGRKLHVLTAFAHVNDVQITYPPPRRYTRQTTLVNEGERSKRNPALRFNRK